MNQVIVNTGVYKEIETELIKLGANEESANAFASYINPENGYSFDTLMRIHFQRKPTLYVNNKNPLKNLFNENIKTKKDKILNKHAVLAMHRLRGGLATNHLNAVNLKYGPNILYPIYNEVFESPEEAAAQYLAFTFENAIMENFIPEEIKLDAKLCLRVAEIAAEDNPLNAVNFIEIGLTHPALEGQQILADQLVELLLVVAQKLLDAPYDKTPRLPQEIENTLITLGMAATFSEKAKDLFVDRIQNYAVGDLPFGVKTSHYYDVLMEYCPSIIGDESFVFYYASDYSARMNDASIIDKMVEKYPQACVAAYNRLTHLDHKKYIEDAIRRVDESLISPADEDPQKKLQKDLLSIAFKEEYRAHVEKFVHDEMSFHEICQLVRGKKSQKSDWDFRKNLYIRDYGVDLFIIRFVISAVLVKMEDCTPFVSFYLSVNQFAQLILQDKSLTACDVIYLLNGLILIDKYHDIKDVEKTIAASFESLDYRDVEMNKLALDTRLLFAKAIGEKADFYNEKILSMKKDSSKKVQKVIQGILER